jgi:hypothetical protein
MANAGCLDLDENFAGFRAFEIDFDDFQRLACLECDWVLYVLSNRKKLHHRAHRCGPQEGTQRNGR